MIHREHQGSLASVLIYFGSTLPMPALWSNKSFLTSYYLAACSNPFAATFAAPTSIQQPRLTLEPLDKTFQLPSH